MIPTTVDRPTEFRAGKSGTPSLLQPDRAGVSGEAVARIHRLVATLKAERGADGVAQQGGEAGEHGRLVALLRRFLAARERERLAWEEATSRLERELSEAKAAAEAARAAREQAADQHQRMLRDIELLHDHQRSIWSLERRRLESTVAALERTLRARATRRKARLAFAASLLLVGVVGVGVASDSDPSATAARLLQQFGTARQLSLIELLR